jgi:non-heme chloroperoxidase
MKRGNWKFIAVWIAIGTFLRMTLPLWAYPVGSPSTPTAYTAQMVTVEPGVQLQVLDWGGSGRTVILLPGLGFDAHEFDDFAPKLTSRYHVYAISRRGFGASSAPSPNAENYSADRLADDILEVMQTLNIKRPVLVGHSIAGEELSSIGTRFPDRVAGLVYLDAGYSYAYYGDNAPPAGWLLDAVALRRELEKLTTPSDQKEKEIQVHQLLTLNLPRVQKELEDIQEQIRSGTADLLNYKITPQILIDAAVLNGFEVYRGVHCPVLAIFADPHAPPPNVAKAPAKVPAWVKHDQQRTTEQADAFQAGNPTARVVKISGASHFVFRSNEAEVLREINSFASSLP